MQLPAAAVLADLRPARDGPASTRKPLLTPDDIALRRKPFEAIASLPSRGIRAGYSARQPDWADLDPGILAAATFHGQGKTGIAGLEEAHHLLSPMLGAPIAGTLFALALLAAGLNSSVTGTLAGQIVMEGFLSIRLAPWLRRTATRLAAVVPVLVTMMLFGERATDKLLVLSQVVLSLQLPFAIIPLIYFTSNRRRMGVFVNSRCLAMVAWTIAALIVGLNLWLLGYSMVR